MDLTVLYDYCMTMMWSHGGHLLRVSARRDSILGLKGRNGDSVAEARMAVSGAGSDLTHVPQNGGSHSQVALC